MDASSAEDRDVHLAMTLARGNHYDTGPSALRTLLRRMAYPPIIRIVNSGRSRPAVRASPYPRDPASTPLFTSTAIRIPAE